MLGIRSRRSASRCQGSSFKKPQRRVERGAPPHLQRKQLRIEPGISVGDGHHVVRPHARGQQRLMGVAKRGVGDQQPLFCF